MTSNKDSFEDEKASPEDRLPGPVNRREFTRLPVVFEAEVVAGESIIRVHQTKNISMNGIFLLGKEKLPLDTDCYLTLFLGDRSNQRFIKARARVVRLEDEGMALFFEEILGADSYIHLRNLLLHNARDTEAVEEEFDTHLGMKRRP